MSNVVTPLLLLLLFACASGAALGVFFFGGLWWTVQRSTSFEHPALLFLASLLFRTLGVVAGFYFLSQRDWRRLLACLLGFLIARLVVTRFTRPRVRVHTALIKEGGL